MKDRDAFGTALQTLRERLRDGAYPPGAPLVIIELAQELRISPTPVREALARLTGEGLVEERRGWGYGVWRLDRDACEELYRFHLLYVEFALDREPITRRGRLLSVMERHGGEGPHALRAATEAVFTAIVDAACQARGVAAHRGVADRLAPLRLAEARLFENGAEELRNLVAAIDDGSIVEASRQIGQYHQRRLEVISSLLRIAATSDRLRP